MEEKLLDRLERAVVRLESISSGDRFRGFEANDGGADASSDAAIAAFDDLIANSAAHVSSIAEKIGDEVLEASKVQEEAFNVAKKLLIDVKQTQKPDPAGMAEFLKPLNTLMAKATSMAEEKRSDYFNHQKAISEGVSALGWIAYTGKHCGMSLPTAHVEESWQMAEFYSNKVLVEYKSNDPNHVEWAKSMKELYVPGLRDFVKRYYPVGPVWSTTGKILKSCTPPGLPPPPSTSLCSSDSSKPSSSSKPGMSAVFAEINAGNVTSGLKKVTDDMKAKNRADRGGMVSAGEKGSHVGSAAASKKVAPPKLELQMGRKWIVENHIGKRDLVINDCDAKQSVYVYGCKDSVLQIQGKVNNITVDKCSKTGVLFQDVVAACEVVNCNSVEVQSQGSAPTISVDNTSGCHLYLNKESLGASITTAKSSEINMLVPSNDGDWAEHSLPQQYVHEYKDGQFVTTPVTHSGA